MTDNSEAIILPSRDQRSARELQSRTLAAPRTNSALSTALVPEQQEIGRGGCHADLPEHGDDLTAVVRRMIDQMDEGVAERIPPAFALHVHVTDMSPEVVVAERRDPLRSLSLDLAELCREQRRAGRGNPFGE